MLRCSPTGFDVGSDRGERDGWFGEPIVHFINIKSFIGSRGAGRHAARRLGNSDALIECAQEITAARRRSAEEVMRHTSEASQALLPEVDPDRETVGAAC